MYHGAPTPIYIYIYIYIYMCVCVCDTLPLENLKIYSHLALPYITLPSKLYWILFPINNLRDAVDAMKRVLTKEKLDKQLSGQAITSTPLMKVGDVLNGKRVSFNVQDSIGEQLENLTLMVYNMSMQKDEGKKPFKPQVYPKRARGQRR